MGAQLSVNYLDEKDTGLDLGGCSEVVEITDFEGRTTGFC